MTGENSIRVWVRTETADGDSTFVKVQIHRDVEYHLHPGCFNSVEWARV